MSGLGVTVMELLVLWFPYMLVLVITIVVSLSVSYDFVTTQHT